MRVVVQSLDKKQLHDVHLLCSDICIPTGSTVTALGGALRRRYVFLAKSTANSSMSCTLPKKN